MIVQRWVQESNRANVPESPQASWRSIHSGCTGIGVVWCSPLPVEVEIRAANWVVLGARSVVLLGRAGNSVPSTEHWCKIFPIFHRAIWPV